MDHLEGNILFSHGPRNRSQKVGTKKSQNRSWKKFGIKRSLNQSKKYLVSCLETSQSERKGPFSPTDLAVNLNIDCPIGLLNFLIFF